MGGEGLLNGQNLLSVTKVIFDDPLRKRLLRHYLTNKNFKVLLGQIASTMKSLCFFVVYVFFPIQHWSCHNNIVTDGGLNLFDDCADECVGRKVYLFFLGTQLIVHSWHHSRFIDRGCQLEQTKMVLLPKKEFKWN